jgi:photosystem I subunit X
MLSFTLLAAASIPHTPEWSPMVGIVMIACNIAAIAIGKVAIANPSAGPALPNPAMFGGMGLPALLATTSFGHILGFATLRILESYGVV